jgi:hypothetical protein
LPQPGRLDQIGNRRLLLLLQELQQQSAVRFSDGIEDCVSCQGSVSGLNIDHDLHRIYSSRGIQQRLSQQMAAICIKIGGDGFR